MVNSENQSPSKRRRWLSVSVALVSMTLVSIYPFETTVVPAWTLKVVDEHGNLVRGAFVRELWQHDSIESKSHEQDSSTDQDGYVTFPSRTIKASLLSRMFGPVVNFITEGIHAGYGPHAHVLALERGAEGWADYTPGQPPPEQIVVRARHSG